MVARCVCVHFCMASISALTPGVHSVQTADTSPTLPTTPVLFVCLFVSCAQNCLAYSTRFESRNRVNNKQRRWNLISGLHFGRWKFTSLSRPNIGTAVQMCICNCVEIYICCAHTGVEGTVGGVTLRRAVIHNFWQINNAKYQTRNFARKLNNQNFTQW